MTQFSQPQLSVPPGPPAPLPALIGWNPPLKKLQPPYILTHPFAISVAAAGYMRGVIKSRMWDPGRTVVLFTLIDGGKSWKMDYVDSQTLDGSQYIVYDCQGCNVGIAASQAGLFQKRLLHFHRYVNNTKFLDLWIERNSESEMTARATEPGRLSLSQEKLRRFCPVLYNSTADEGPWCEHVIRQICRQMWEGDGRAAVVALLRPLTIAAYSSDLDGVVLLRFPDELVEEYRLEAGSRLFCLNFYGKDKPANPVIQGPGSSGQWGDFSPIIAEFFSDDLHQAGVRKLQIAESEWERAAECALAALRAGAKPRDGRYPIWLLHRPYWSPVPISAEGGAPPTTPRAPDSVPINPPPSSATTPAARIHLAPHTAPPPPAAYAPAQLLTRPARIRKKLPLRGWIILFSLIGIILLLAATTLGLLGVLISRGLR
ncbi:MAG TPA: hypothetical protein VFE47_16660 [Tepidisphaeraceae bacterium]|nr:hypothetical protein [Tepidisphaeraceae bacterium]